MNRTAHRTALMATFGCLLGLLGCSVQSDSNRPTSPDAAAEEPPKRAHDPLLARSPAASRSLTMPASWSPPRPMKSKPARMKPRVEPAKSFGVPSKPVSPTPSDAEIAAVPHLPQPLRPVPGTSSKAETDALATALNEQPDADRGVEGLRHFVEAHPTSRWAPGIHLNIGTISYGAGYFQDALVHWKSAWELAKAGDDEVSQQTANQAVAEYAKMNARLGRMSEIEALVEIVKERHFMGDARVKMQAALEGLGTMRTRPGVAFKCGPFALANVATQLAPGSEKKTGAFLESVQSPTKGFSVAEVHAMAPRLGLNLQMAKREPGASLIVPSVVHWKVGHFAAVMREESGRYLVKDPTFGNETWMTRDALDHEASGTFLVATGALPKGWSKANAAEAAKLYGKGYTGTIEPDDTSDDDEEDGGGPEPDCQDPNAPPTAMAVYRFHLLAASLHIEDTPVGHSAAVGSDVRVRVAYNQRESGQPTSIDFTSFGPQFVSNWVSYLVDNTTNAAANVTLRKRGGGGETHTGYSSGTQSWTRDVKTAAVLYRLTSNTYKKVYPDGREEFYEQYIGTTGTQRRVFLTKLVDPQGNAVTISYDTTYPTRISQIVDATGLATVFHYAVSGQPYLVSSIEDPYGREATFTYATAASALRLQSIEDTIGIVSTFAYDSNGEITSMTTPYGTTTFGLSPLWYDTGHNLIRYLEATDPLGQKERLEYTLSAYITRVMPTLEQPRPSSSVVSYSTNADENANRNTFYWDKLAMKLAPGDYLKAHIYHWVRPSTTDVATSILESEVRPLEGRIFYNYPGQSQPNIKGTLKSPSVVARVVKDAAGTTYTQATKYEYNTIGNVTKIIDPVGRERLIEYASNRIDVTAIKQRTGTSGGSPVWTTISTYTYGGGAPAHRPATMTDGAGKTTSYTYASNGQVLTTTNAKSEVTTFTYETNTSSPAYRRLLTLTGDVPGGNQTFTYDTTGRLATVTNSEGYTLAYDYDALDRIRTITYPDSSVEQREYEDHSLVASKDREGRWTRHMYNPLRERVVTQDPALRTTQTQWCRCGQLRRFVDGNGNITEWQRDVASRVTKKIQANGSFETYGYDFSGRRVSEVDAMSRTTSYEYTLDDRVSKKDYSDTATPDVTYAYDTYFPRQTSRVDGAGTTTFAYHAYGTSTNGAGQVSLINGPLSDDTQKHTYDELGRLKKLEIVDDATQTTASYSEEYTFDEGPCDDGGEQPREHDVRVRGAVEPTFDGELPERDADALRLLRRDERSPAEADQEHVGGADADGDLAVRLHVCAGPSDRDVDAGSGERREDVDVRVRRRAAAHVGEASELEQRGARRSDVRLRQGGQPHPSRQRNDGAEELRRQQPESAAVRAGSWQDDVRGDRGRAFEGDGERQRGEGAVDRRRGAVQVRGGGEPRRGGEHRRGRSARRAEQRRDEDILGDDDGDGEDVRVRREREPPLREAAERHGDQGVPVGPAEPPGAVPPGHARERLRVRRRVEARPHQGADEQRRDEERDVRVVSGKDLPEAWRLDGASKLLRARLRRGDDRLRLRERPPRQRAGSRRERWIHGGFSGLVRSVGEVD